MSDRWASALIVVRVVCYGAAILPIVSLIVSGIADPLAWFDELLEQVLGRGAAFSDAGGTFFVVVMLWVGALALLPGDVTRLFWWNERRNGRL